MVIRKFRGLKLRRKVVRIFKWLCKPKSTIRYEPLLCSSSSSSTTCKKTKKSNTKTKTMTMTMTMTKIYNWGRFLKQGAKKVLTCSASSYDYHRMEDKVVDEVAPPAPPKGHLAVYVGDKDDEDHHPHRFLVPVIYFNHPLFLQLLREAEKEFGFQHPGGITIPCPVSQFQNVQTRIAAAGHNKPICKRLLPL